MLTRFTKILRYGLTEEEIKRIKLPKIRKNSDYDIFTLEEVI